MNQLNPTQQIRAAVSSKDRGGESAASCLEVEFP
jgi:hypothetical protein